MGLIVKSMTNAAQRFIMIIGWFILTIIVGVVCMIIAFGVGIAGIFHDGSKRQYGDAGQPVILANLTEDDIGRWVEHIGYNNVPIQGRIKSWNDKWIFVVYKCDDKWSDFQNYTGCATKPSHLIFV